ncbi:MAG: 50S ribosomal protein L5 [Alphaproteobacteria bacterium]|nr:50S ribosomal protein L5 [Alphaproteobacteria bacterium]
MQQILTKEKNKTIFQDLKDVCGWTNVMQTPRLSKIIVSVGIGKVRKDAQKIKLIADRLQKITGQKAAIRKSKVSIAQFKLREGENVGYIVTLRGKHMYAFFDKLIHIALPRSRDFRGLSKKSIDAMGNLSIGIREHTIFRETSEENVADVFPLGITIVATTKDKKTAEKYFTALGVPFQE